MRNGFRRRRIPLLQRKDVLGVHRFDADIPRSTDLDVGQIMSAAISNHIIEMDISPLLLDRIVRAGPDSMNVLDNKDAIAMRLVNNGVLPPIWNIEGGAESSI